MVEPQTMETARLTLRALSMSDAADLYPAFSDAVAMRYWHTLPHTNVGETAAALADMLNHAGYWWAICLPSKPENNSKTENSEMHKGDQRAIGFAGYHHTVGRAGFGYMLHPAYWRQGYATEAVRAALTYGFNALAIERVELWIHTKNSASRRLAQKLGFTNQGQFLQKFPNETSAHATQVYGMCADEWPESTQNGSKSEPSCPFYSVQPVLPVSDIEATLAYYQAKLGFTVDFVYGDPPSHAGVSHGEWTAQAVRIQFTVADNPSEIRPCGQLYLMVGVGIDRLYDAYCANGVHIRSALQNKPWGMREFTIEDGNGYVLRFGTPN
jgi:ribosomal-protein-alanine N-acetyltransferase